MPSEPERYFPETYGQARAAFVDEASAAGATIASASHPTARGPAGEDLITDIAWFGERTAPRVFVSISGTHGQEFFAGAATQRSWIARGGPDGLPDGVAVCLAHANNAYGAAHSSRTNENNVDPNRNYFDHAKPRTTDPLYADFHETVFPRRNAAEPFIDGTADFIGWCERHTPEQLVSALDVGQQTHPDGLIYCGVGEAWTTRNLKAVASEFLGQAEKLAIIDWHTGIGDYATTTVLRAMDPASEEFRWSCAWWGQPANLAAQAKPLPPEEIGYIHSGLAADLRRRGAMVASTVIEWGTFDNPSVIGALLIDRWLRFECSDPHAPEAVKWRTRMMERLNPSLHSWREAVVGGSAAIYANTIKGLSLWP